MSKVKNRRTVTVVQDLFQLKTSPNNFFTRNIIVGFTPDECIMRNIIYCAPSAGETTVLMIQSNIMKNGDGIIGFIAPTINAINAGSMIAPQNQFPVDINAVGLGASSIFTIMNPVIGSTTGKIAQSTTSSGDLSFILEFIEYEKTK